MPPQPLILFDGVCNLCNSVVNFAIRQDKKGLLKFAPLQSSAGQKVLQTFQLPQKDFETFLLIKNDRVYQQSSAALQVAKYFGWYWQWLRLFWLVPKPLRDKVYQYVARNRYRWFGKKEACMIPTPQLLQRFLTDDKDNASSGT